jgi:hypothetical protein
VLDLVDLISGYVGGFEMLANRLKVDAVLGEQGLILPEAVDEFPLLWLLLTPSRGLRRNDLAVDTSLDTVGTRLILIAAYFTLLTENA